MADADAAPKRNNICGRSEDELMRELMDDRNAFLLLAQDADDRPALSPRENYTVTNKLISTVYSGPTIGDVAAALAMSSSGGSGEYSGSHGYLRSCRIALPEKGFNKMEGKFTTRVKCSSNGSIADDGYKWRKYGQKFIKNSPHPRSYYRCTNPRCNAKKQVERSAEDPEALVVTYEGLHLHFAFSHFLLPRAPWDAATIAAAPTFLSVKRAKVDDTRAALQASKLQEAPAGSFASAASAGSPAGLAVEGSCSLPEPGDQADAAAANIPVVKRDEALFGNAQSSLEPAPEGARGLLEDVVPGLVRNPCSSSSSSSGADVGVLSDLAASLFSGPSSPPSSSAPSSPFSWPLFDDLYALSMPSSPTSTSSSSAPFSWPHDPSFFDMAMLAGAVGAETHVAT